MHAALDAGRQAAAAGPGRRHRRSSVEVHPDSAAIVCERGRQGRAAHGVRREVLAARGAWPRCSSTARSPSTPTRRTRSAAPDARSHLGRVGSRSDAGRRRRPGRVAVDAPRRRWSAGRAQRRRRADASSPATSAAPTPRRADRRRRSLDLPALIALADRLAAEDVGERRVRHRRGLTGTTSSRTADAVTTIVVESLPTARPTVGGRRPAGRRRHRRAADGAAGRRRRRGGARGRLRRPVRLVPRRGRPRCWRRSGCRSTHAVTTYDYTTPETRDVYRRTHRERKDRLGGAGVFPGAGGILMSRLHRPGVLVALDVTASRLPLTAVNPGWTRYETLTYTPGVLAGDTLYMSGFAALDMETQEALLPGRLARRRRRRRTPRSRRCSTRPAPVPDHAGARARVRLPRRRRRRRSPACAARLGSRARRRLGRRVRRAAAARVPASRSSRRRCCA